MCFNDFSRIVSLNWNLFHCISVLVTGNKGNEYTFLFTIIKFLTLMTVNIQITMKKVVLCLTLLEYTKQDSHQYKWILKNIEQV